MSVAIIAVVLWVIVVPLVVVSVTEVGWRIGERRRARRRPLGELIPINGLLGRSVGQSHRSAIR